MSKDKTLVTEVVTALGTIPTWELDFFGDGAPPPEELVGCEGREWERLVELWNDQLLRPEFIQSFSAGRYLLNANDGLRSRPPRIVEWKGPHQAPEHDPLPVDIRVDHVFAISCKNDSKILLNPSPTSLFRHALTEGGARGLDWFHESAPDEYLNLMRATFRYLELGDPPPSVAELGPDQRVALKTGFRSWPTEIQDEVDAFVAAVSVSSAKSLNQALPQLRDRERFYWRIMRIHSSPYFMLGTQRSRPVHLRVLTPWDLRRRYEFLGLEISPDPQGQAQVRWRATIRDGESDSDLVTEGHIEIRWSHGRFNKAPEGKIYLDTPHELAAGYVPI